MIEKHAVNILRELHQIISENEIRCWLDQGVALGAVRERKFISHDTDIDMSLLYRDTPRLLAQIPKFKRLGYSVRVHCNNIFMIKNGIVVGIACYQPRENVYFHIDYCMAEHTEPKKLERGLKLEFYYDVATHGELQTISNKNMTRLAKSPRWVRWLARKVSFALWKQCGGVYFGYVAPKRFFDNLETVKFYGMKFLLPSPIEEYLEFKYGHNWKIPNPKWDMWHDDGAILTMRDLVDHFNPWLTLKDLL